MPDSDSTPPGNRLGRLLQDPRVAGGTVVLLALAARVLYATQVRSLLLFKEPTGDAAHYLSLARQVATEGLWAPPGVAYFQAPFYPWYLAALGGSDGLVAARALQWLAGVLGALLAWDTTRRVGGAAAGFVAGGLAALYAPRIFFEGELLAISWCLLFLQAMLWCLVGHGASPGARRAGAAGALGGLAALAQPNALLAGVAAVGGLVLIALRAPRPDRGRRGRVALACALGLALPLLPVTLRNQRESGDWILISSNSGVNFFIGNHPGANGTFDIPPDTPLRNDSAGLATSSTELAARALGGAPGPSAVSGYWFRRGIDFWRDQPLAGAALAARKVLYLVNTAELPNHYAIDFFRDRVPILRFLPSFFLLATLGLWGVVRRADAPELRLLWLAGAGYAVSVVLYFVTDRYRLPLIAVLLPAAGLGFTDLAALLHRRRTAEISLAAATLASLAILTLVPLVDTTPATAHMHNLSGTILYRRGDLPEATREFEAALRLEPGHAEALNNLGRIQLLAGDPVAAERCFRGALERNPGLPEAWFNLEELERNRRNWTEALRALDGLEAAVPGARSSFGPTLAYRRGLARQALGDTADARRLLSSAVQSKPDLAAAWAALAGLDQAAERWVEARRGFEMAAGLSPEYWGHAYNLGIVSERMGDYAAAESAYSKAAGLAPRLPEAKYRAAIMQMVLGRSESGLVTFRELASQEYPPALYQLGRHADRQGQRRAALEFYRRTVRAGGPQDEIRLAAERLVALEGKP